jgi:hypothetical protein
MLYVLILPFELKVKSLTKYFVDHTALLDSSGLPSSGTFGIFVLPSDLILLVLLTGWFLRILVKKDTLYFPPVCYLVVVFFGWLVVGSLLKSQSLYLSAVDFIQECKYFLVALYILNNVSSERMVKGLVAALLCALLAESAFNIMVYQGDGLSFISRIYERTEDNEKPNVVSIDLGMDKKIAEGTFGNSALTASYLCLLLSLPSVSLLISRNLLLRLFYLLCCGVGFWAAWITYARAPLIGLLGSLAIMIYLLHRAGALPTKQYAVIVSVLLVSSIAFAPKLTSFLTTRPDTVTSRIPLLQEGLKMIADNPVLGVGWNNSTLVKFNSTLNLEEREFPIHNYWVILLSEVGLVGLLVYIAFFIQIARYSYQGLASASPLERGICGMTLTILIFLSIYLWADPFIGNAQHSMLWFCVGLVLAARKTTNEVG